MKLPVLKPDHMTLMIKPVGAMCNLNCTYCYYLPTLEQWAGRQRRMSLQTLESVFAGTLPRFADEVTIAWQGGEPTLAGLEFFQNAVQFARKYARPNQRIAHGFQTNGTLLNDQWCQFFRRNNFLIGISLDGPSTFHNHYRLTNQGQPTHQPVLRAIDLLKKHGVPFNVLCVLNNRNIHDPDQLVSYLINRGIDWLQFIPAIEWETNPHTVAPQLASYSPDPKAYGRFLCRVFDLWFQRYRHRISIRIFDSILNKLVLDHATFCIHNDRCHTQITVEHDGSIFGCDHYVEPRWKLGQITSDNDANEQPDCDWFGRLDESTLNKFAQRKRFTPEQCQKCQWRSFCFGGCPKHRPHRGEIPEATVLCEGYRIFFEHAMDRLEWLAGYLRRGQQPPLSQPVGAPVDFRNVSRNARCPCGSGRKFKRCHGKGAR